MCPDIDYILGLKSEPVIASAFTEFRGKKGKGTYGKKAQSNVLLSTIYNFQSFSSV